ncbi:MAG: cobalamin-binding protein [Treponema sp.]|jgi:iron complex transport system substrate-binding protein|nr:cobalamin-binding protein [Treponema sp.]
MKLFCSQNRGKGFSCLLFFFITASLFSNERNSPKRIVSLSPAATEILCAVGAYNEIVARTDFCDFPPEVTVIPSVGGFDGKTLSLEKIISFQPDFVYAVKGMHDHLVAPLEKLGIKVYVSDAKSISSIITEIHTIGSITGHEKKAAETTAQIESLLLKVRDALQNEPAVTVYWEVWNAPYMTAGSSSFINEVIKDAGGINIFADIRQAYPVVSEESILARDPKVIVLAKTSGIQLQDVAERTGWQSVTAVRNKKIVIVDDTLTLRPGPRIAQAVLDLALSLHPRNAKLTALKNLQENNK